MHSVLLSGLLAAASLVQEAHTSGPFTVSPVEVTLTAAPQPGNVLVVAVFYLPGSSITSVVDADGVPQSLIHTQTGVGGFAQYVQQLYATRVTSTMAGARIGAVGTFNGYVELVVAEYSGLDPSAPLGAPLTLVSPSPPVTIGPVAASPDDRVLLWVNCEGVLTGVEPGYTVIANLNGDLLVDRPIVDAGLYDATGVGSCNAWMGAFVTLQSLRGDGGTTVPDAGAPDAGAPDAGTRDAGITDAGATDAVISPPDAGNDDAGTDAGVDAGAPAEPKVLQASCGCQSAGPGLLALLLTAASLGRRTPPRRSRCRARGR